MKSPVVLAFLFAVVASGLDAEEASPALDRNIVEVFPVGEINLIQYGRMLDQGDELLAGLIWYDPQVMGLLSYPGTERILALEAGYRRFLWGGLHLEVELMPQLLLLHEAKSGRDSSLLGLATEIRAGYRWDFSLFGAPLFVDLQLFAGYYLVDRRPADFIAADRERNLHPLYWSPVPLIFLGLRF